MKIFVKVKPAAKKDMVEKNDDSHFIVSVKEPPKDGKANQAVIKLLAEYFGINQSRVKIISGYASKQKIIIIS